MRIGIDLGGTKIEGVMIAPDGQILARHRVATPSQDYGRIIAAIRDLIATLETDLGANASIGIAMPGTISPYSGLVKNANSTCLNGRPFDRDMIAALGRPIRVANDADCFALSEASDGAAAGSPVAFGVILGTGVGGGIVIEGHLLQGSNAIAGEWGHNPLPWPRDDERPGPPCYCGKTGCIETFLSGAGLVADHLAMTGELSSAALIAAEASQGRPAAADTMRRYADRLARSLASVINILDPEVIVLGGGLSKISSLYDLVPPLFPRFVFSDHVVTRLVPPLHGDASGVRGAAWLWPPETV